MASRASLNKVLLIGNLTRDPELRYTPSGAAVCTFGVATNRSYTASDGNKKEEVEFTKIVAWNKLGELCSQLLTKGRKVYVEGRMQTRSWETPDGQNRQTTEVVIDDMRILDSRRNFEEGTAGQSYQAAPVVAEVPEEKAIEEESKKQSAGGAKGAKGVKEAKGDIGEKGAKDKKEESDDVNLEDLPF